MAGQKLKRDMVVAVISGAHRGKTGKILKVDREKQTVLVEGVNRAKHAVRRSQSQPQGGLVESERPVHISNVMAMEKWEARRARRGAGAATAVEGKK